MMSSASVAGATISCPDQLQVASGWLQTMSGSVPAALAARIFGSVSRNGTTSRFIRTSAEMPARANQASCAATPSGRVSKSQNEISRISRSTSTSSTTRWVMTCWTGTSLMTSCLTIFSTATSLITSLVTTVSTGTSLMTSLVTTSVSPQAPRIMATVAVPPAAAASRNKRRRLSVPVGLKVSFIPHPSARAGRMRSPPHNPSTQTRRWLRLYRLGAFRHGVARGSRCPSGTQRHRPGCRRRAVESACTSHGSRRLRCISRRELALQPPRCVISACATHAPHATLRP